jgi:hypothetical protein
MPGSPFRVAAPRRTGVVVLRDAISCVTDGNALNSPSLTPQSLNSHVANKATAFPLTREGFVRKFSSSRYRTIGSQSVNTTDLDIHNCFSRVRSSVLWTNLDEISDCCARVTHFCVWPQPAIRKQMLQKSVIFSATLSLQWPLPWSCRPGWPFCASPAPNAAPHRQLAFLLRRRSGS